VAGKFKKFGFQNKKREIEPLLIAGNKYDFMSLSFILYIFRQ